MDEGVCVKVNALESWVTTRQTGKSDLPMAESSLPACLDSANGRRWAACAGRMKQLRVGVASLPHLPDQSGWILRPHP